MATEHQLLVKTVWFGLFIVPSCTGRGRRGQHIHRGTLHNCQPNSERVGCEVGTVDQDSDDCCYQYRD